MEQKLSEYHKYDFANDQRWQTKLKNVYPVPPTKQLDKMRRKWYKANVDKDFDVEYQAGTYNDPNSEFTPHEQQRRAEHA